MCIRDRALGRDGGQAAVGVAQDQQRVGLDLDHEPVARGDDVAKNPGKRA